MSFIRNRALLVFYVLAVLVTIIVMALSITGPAATDPDFWPNFWAWLAANETYGNLLTIGRYAIEEEPFMGLVFPFAAAPTIAAIIVVALGWRTGGLLALLDRFKFWRAGVGWREGLAVYSIMGAIFFAVSGVFVLHAATTDAESVGRIIASLGGGATMGVIGTLLLGAFIDEGGTLEELGWRGFALPVLLDRYAAPLLATIVLGVLWWAWHIPREIPSILSGFAAFDGGFMQFATGQAVFLVLCVMQSIVITFVYFRTGGSVWAGVLVHGATNVWSKAIIAPAAITPSFGGGVDLRTLVVIVIAIAILIFAGPRLGQRDIPNAWTTG